MDRQEKLKEPPVIICLTPVRNEAWILDTFLKCTSIWADFIVIADQGSTDGSREIAKNYPKVRLIHNISTDYNEVSRQRLLIDEARKIPGRRLLITLDADEFFTSDFMETPDWEQMLNGEEGDVFAFRWVNLCPDFRHYWLSAYFPWALLDDGSEHAGEYIHNPRLPVRDHKVNNLESIKVLHYQYINWERMKSKHRYYQCLERIKSPEKSAVGIYRMYHHMMEIKQSSLMMVKDEFFGRYEDQNIPIRNFTSSGHFWYDQEVLKFFKVFGTERFRKEAIWDAEWGKYSGITNVGITLRDPRSLTDRIIHLWLKKTQGIRTTRLVKRIDRVVEKYWR